MNRALPINLLKSWCCILFFMALSLQSVRAQYVTIPDSNFVRFIRNNAPGCLTGNQLDTTCPGLMKIDTIYLMSENIQDLWGLQYFDSLIGIDCQYNKLSALPPLPQTLKYIVCGENLLTELPPLPPNLLYLSCNNNKLSELPVLPDSLSYLYCPYNNISELPVLPDSLKDLFCNNNVIKKIPNFPQGLQVIFCDSNALQSLPSLPTELREFQCFSNLLDKLPALPKKLRRLNISDNRIEVLPDLPLSLYQLQCSKNRLKKLPVLPQGMYSLTCDDNLLDSLPDLPPQMMGLLCQNNHLKSLPTLPPKLFTLVCNHNKLTSLPALPLYLRRLICGNNQLTQLPPLPSTIESLNCDSNLLQELPYLPKSLTRLYCMHNKITCFPAFHQSQVLYMNLTGNPYTCLANHIQGMDAEALKKPLCSPDDELNNPYKCLKATGIDGLVFLDKNKNCTPDAEPSLSYFSLTLKNDTGGFLSRSYSGWNGGFTFSLLKGNYMISLDTAGLPLLANCNINPHFTINPIDTVSRRVDIGLSCKPGFDIGVQSIVPRGIVFPGQNHLVKVNAGDISKALGFNCSDGVSGQINISVSGKTTFQKADGNSLKPTSVNGNDIVYAIDDFGKLNNNSLDLIFRTDTNASASDSICVYVTVSSPQKGDNNPKNNSRRFCYKVMNSYDPNMKEVYPVNVLEGFKDWLTYTIHFQNTGSAPAFNIRLADTLDQNLDPETFQLLEYSHAIKVSQNSCFLSFSFRDIMLPDSHSNSEGSHGFVQYRIKPKTGLPLGTKIQNTAFIYFDYNDPVITNTTVNEYVKPNTSMSSAYIRSLIRTFPNPANGKVNIVSERDFQVTVTDVTGKTMLKGNNITELNLPAGVFLFEYMIEGVRMVEKVVVF